MVSFSLTISSHIPLNTKLLGEKCGRISIIQKNKD